MKPQPTPGGWVSTLISGTEILDSGFLSNIRVIKSFKKSVTSGLGKGDGRDEVGKGLDAASLFHPGASYCGSFPGNLGLDASPGRDAAPGTHAPRCHAALPPKPPQGSKISPFWAIQSMIPYVPGRESPTPTPPRLKPNRQQLQRLIHSPKHLCSFNHSFFGNCKPRDIAFPFNAKEVFQGRGPTEGLRA